MLRLLESPLRATVLAYHPRYLQFTFVEDRFAGTHPRDPLGQDTPVVGVHGIVPPPAWEFTPEGVMGQLQWHPTTLAAWTGTRAEFAAQDADTQHRALSVGPNYDAGRWGTHFGATLSTVTADGFTLLRSRAGKYAEAHLYDSLIAGTMRMSDLTNTSDGYFSALIKEANIPDSVIASMHPTHLAMRSADFGLWLGGWLEVTCTASELAAMVPFETKAFPVMEAPDVAVTDWGLVDWHAMRLHLVGEGLIEPVAQP